MMEVVGTEQVRRQQGLQALQEEMLKLEQVEIPITHHFADGTYSRTVVVPAGTIAIGQRQRYKTLNIITKGKIIMYDGAGKPGKEVSAPFIYTSEPGDKKMGVFTEDSEWTSVHPNPTDERDIDVLESRILISEQEYLSTITKLEGENK